MVKVIGPVTPDDDITPPPDLPPATGDTTPPPPRPAQPGGRRTRGEHPYEVAVPFVRATVPPSVWDRCTWWWERQEKLGTVAGQGLTLDQRLAVYLQHATSQHWLLDLRQPPQLRQYDWIASQAADIAAIVATQRLVISDEAARAQVDADVAILRDIGAPLTAIEALLHAKGDIG